MKRVFVCSPYRGDVARNVAVARAVCRQVAQAGDAPFAPHLLYPEFLDDTDAGERERGIRSGVAWLAVTDEVLVVGTPTEGMRAEIAAAEVLGLPVRRVDAPAVVTLPAGRAAEDPLRRSLAVLVNDWGPLLAIALLVLVFLLCPGCVGAAPAADVPVTFKASEAPT